MTASEKGKELIEKFKPLVRDRKTERTDTHITGSIGQHVITENAKACAIICVDEILEECYELIGWEHKGKAEFWQSVRAYIEGNK